MYNLLWNWYLKRSYFLRKSAQDSDWFYLLRLGVCFGEIALLGSGNMNRRTANVRAHGFTTLYVLFKVALLVNRYIPKLGIGQIGVTERKIGLGTGKSLSEALTFALTNPQYDHGLFIELQVQYMKIPSSNLGRTCCVQKLFWMSKKILYHNMFWARNFHVLNL